MSKEYNYDNNGEGYSTFRKADPGIAKYIHAALGSARSILNVGAGTGSYEPDDREITAVEPSETMRLQRKKHLKPAINANAEDLPFSDISFEASMALLTIHHWSDPAKGLREMRRVTSGPVVILTFDRECIDGFWLYDYCPEIVESDKKRFPSIKFITDLLGDKCTIEAIALAVDCTDGIQEAFYARPEAFLNPEIRKSQSAWGVLASGIEERVINELSADIKSGEWDKKYGHFRNQPTFKSSLRLITSWPE